MVNKNLLLGCLGVLALGFSTASQAAINIQCMGRGHSSNGASVAQMNAVATGAKASDGQTVVQGDANMVLVRGGRFNIPIGKIKIAGTYSKLATPAKLEAIYLVSPDQPKITAITVNLLQPTDSYVIFDDELYWMACQAHQ